MTFGYVKPTKLTEARVPYVYDPYIWLYTTRQVYCYVDKWK
jgi:hypothetical protein